MNSPFNYRLGRPNFIVLTLGTILLCLLAGYLSLVMLPFYMNGIWLHSYDEILRGQFDPFHYAPFSWFLVGSYIYVGSILALGLFRIGGIISTVIIVLILCLQWSKFSKIEKLVWTASVLSFLVVVVTTWATQDIFALWLGD